MDPAWPRQADAAAAMYDAEPVLRAALDVAEVEQDGHWLGELAAIFTLVADRFVPVGELRQVRGNDLGRAGPDARRILPWRNGERSARPVAECLMCTGQVLFPAARLLRALAIMPAADRPQETSAFVQAVLPLLVHDHLLGGAFLSQWSNGRGLYLPLVAQWKQGQGVGLRDRDLWMIGAAAEVISAAAADSDLVPISREVRDSLRMLLWAGVGRWRASVVQHDPVTDRSGRVVPVLGVFEGDFDGHPDYRYAGITDSVLPSGPSRDPPSRIGWDVAHAYRIPVVLRAVWEGRSVSGVDWPDSSSIVGLINGYLVRAFVGNLAQPRFRNFLDGTDGWYRVGYKGADFGYPPSRWCDARRHGRPCLSSWAVVGWGELAGAAPELRILSSALTQLALDQGPSGREWRDRYYRAYDAGLGMMGPDGRPAPSILMAIVLAESLYGQTLHLTADPP